jgi:3',5'-cyclic AMP phosphodiesterase CpdA
VKLRNDVAIVAISSAVPRLPLVSAGEIGQAQLAALARILEHGEVATRTIVVALHHPPVNRWTHLKNHLEGLRDAAALLALLRPFAKVLLVHGHLHRRVQRLVVTDAGTMHQIGATSASLHHDAPDRMAGFNVYDIDGDRIARVEAHVYFPEARTFRIESVPKHV